MKLGIIKISNTLIDCLYSDFLYIDKFQDLFKNIIPLEIENGELYKTYKCYSEMFENINEGQIIPEYEVMYENDKWSFRLIE